MEGVNVLHCVKREGCVRVGEMSGEGTCSGGICSGGNCLDPNNTV